MKKIFFKKVFIQNFLSIGREGVEISFHEGISLITGENRDKGGRNGVGKSSVVESIYWALFGSTIRDIKKDKILHNQSKDSCEVKIYFDVIGPNKKEEYILSRKLEPNKVELLCDGVDITRSSMPKTDELIKELIGANEEVFQNAVIMTANNTMPFMAQKKVDKRKFIEGVLHLGIFGEMLLKVRSDMNEAKKENDIIFYAFSDKQKSIKIYKDQFLKEEELKKQKLKNFNTRIEDNLKKIETESLLDIEELQKKKNNINSLILSKKDKIVKLKQLQTECCDELEKIKREEYLISHDLKKYKDSLTNSSLNHKECPTCKRPYLKTEHNHSADFISECKKNIERLEEDKKNVTSSIKLKNKTCSDIFKIISKLEEEIEVHHQELHSYSMKSNNINNLLENNKDIEKEIQEIISSKNNFEEIIQDAEKELIILEENLSLIQKKISMLESAKLIVSEEGVKTFIIKKLLNILNTKLNFYLQALEAPCKCEFNETFEETIYNEKGIECSYFNFSGGERKRIDLAVLFMFQDILRQQTGVSFSLSMYDELFDSALDEKGVDKILNILRERVDKYNESIYIISHNKSAIRSEINQVILLEKQDGSTRIVQ